MTVWIGELFRGDQAKFPSAGDGLAAVLYVEFGENISIVGFDRIGANEQPFGDFLV